MAHGPLPPVPILVVPVDVANELLELGLAAVSRNPFGEFDAGIWWQGLLMLSGGASEAITLAQGIATVPKLAKLIYRWNRNRGTKNSTGEDESGQCSLHYKTANGMAILDLNQNPDVEVLTKWLSATYEILAEDAKLRDCSICVHICP